MTKDLRVGVIIKTHGIKGELKVYPTTDSPLRFDEISHVNIRKKDKSAGDFRILNVKYSAGLVILKLEGIRDINEALKYKGAELYIPREEGAVLGEGE